MEAAVDRNCIPINEITHSVDLHDLISLMQISQEKEKRQQVLRVLQRHEYIPRSTEKTKNLHMKKMYWLTWGAVRIVLTTTSRVDPVLLARLEFVYQELSKPGSIPLTRIPPFPDVDRSRTRHNNHVRLHGLKDKKLNQLERALKFREEVYAARTQAKNDTITEIAQLLSEQPSQSTEAIHRLLSLVDEAKRETPGEPGIHCIVAFFCS
jgi:hypothetical protein